MFHACKERIVRVKKAQQSRGSGKENETHTQIETALGKRKQEILPDHVKRETKKLKIKTP
jgi:hypothetical protein